MMGIASAQPILVWGSGSQEAIIVAISFNNGAHISFLVRPRVFLRPGHDFAERRAQPSSRLAGTVVARRIGSYPGHALATASPVRSLMVGTIDRARRRR